MRTLTSVIAVWLALGVATLGPVHRTLVDGCHAGVSARSAVLGHVVAWPVSVLSLWGLSSRC